MELRQNTGRIGDLWDDGELWVGWVRLRQGGISILPDVHIRDGEVVESGAVMFYHNGFISACGVSMNKHGKLWVGGEVWSPDCTNGWE